MSNANPTIPPGRQETQVNSILINQTDGLNHVTTRTGDLIASTLETKEAQSTQIIIKKNFKDGETSAKLEGPGGRSLLLEKIDTNTLKLTTHLPDEIELRNLSDYNEEGDYIGGDEEFVNDIRVKTLQENGGYEYTDHGRKTRVKLKENGVIERVTQGPYIEYVLPIIHVKETISEERNNLSRVTIQEGWAYLTTSDGTQEAYSEAYTEFANGGGRDTFHDGLPERVENEYLSVKSGYSGSFGNGTHFRTIQEAEIRAQEIVESSKKLDTPSIECNLGKISPRELHWIKRIVHILNLQPYHDDEGNTTIDDLLGSANMHNLDTLKWYIESLPKSQEVYDAMKNGWGGPEKEADRIRKMVAGWILERNN